MVTIITQSAFGGTVPVEICERARATIEKLRQQDDFRTPAGSPPWLIMHSLLAFGPEYQLTEGSEAEKRIIIAEHLAKNQESLRAKQYSPFFCCGPKLIIADRGSTNFLGERHPFQFLWCMSEANMPITARISVKDHSPVTIAEICRDAEKQVTEFSSLAWALPTIAHYKGLNYKWTNRFDEQFTIESLLNKLLDHKHSLDEFCANSHKAFCIAKLLQLSRKEIEFTVAAISEATRWIDLMWESYESNTKPDGQIDYQVAGWPAWPSESLEAAAKCGAAGHTLAWMALSCNSPSRRALADSVAEQVIESLNEAVIPGGRDGIMARGQICHGVHGLRLYVDMVTKGSLSLVPE